MKYFRYHMAGNGGLHCLKQKRGTTGGMAHFYTASFLEEFCGLHCREMKPKQSMALLSHRGTDGMARQGTGMWDAEFQKGATCADKAVQKYSEESP